MEKLQSILVAIDRSDAAGPALAKAIALARRFGAQVELFLCDAERAFALKHEYDTRGVSDAREDSLAASRRYLERLRTSADCSELRVAIDAACESPLYEGIVHKVQQSCPDLVIRGTGGDGETAITGLSATDWALVRTCPVPLMLVRNRSWSARPRIAAAVDVSREEGQELTRTILRTAAFFKSGCDGSLEIVYGDDGAEAGAAALESHRAALRTRVEQAGVRPEQLHVLVGEPAKTLPEFAAGRGYDLLVLGALTHREALTALVGTLTGRLMETLACDFLLVKPAAFVCPVGGQAAGPAVSTG